MKPKRVICLGNRFVDRDSAGFEVWKRLASTPLPPGVELVDGGLGGLDLLRFVEGTDQVVFVDSVSGFGRGGEVLRLGADEVAGLADGGFDHSAGLPFLLRAAAVACEGELPGISVIGIEEPADDRSIARAAAAALESLAGVGVTVVEAVP